MNACERLDPYLGFLGTRGTDYKRYLHPLPWADWVQRWRDVLTPLTAACPDMSSQLLRRPKRLQRDDTTDLRRAQVMLCVHVREHALEISRSCGSKCDCTGEGMRR